MNVELIPVAGLPEIHPGDDLASILFEAVRDIGARDGDVLAITQKVVSKAEGRLVDGTDREAVIAGETRRVVARRGDLLIAETAHGLVCANAGVDASNLDPGVLSLLPADPDASAERLRADLVGGLGIRIGVTITDTFGRPWREGVVNVAIGSAGIPVLVDLRGTPDDRGVPLEVTVVALADEIAAASGLVMGKTARVPAAIVRGVDTAGAPAGVARDLVRAPADDMFRESPLQAIHAARTPSSFGDGPVPRAAIEEAVVAALADADTDVRFAAVDSAAGRRRVISALGAADAGMLGHGPFTHEPPVLVVLLAPPGDAGSAQAGSAAERMRLALRAQGYAAAWHTISAGESLPMALGLEESRRAAVIAAVGSMPGAGPAPPHRLSDPGSLRWR